MAPPRRLNRRLRIHSQIENIVQNLQIGLRLLVGSRAPAGSKKFPALKNHIGVQRVRRPFARLQRVGFARVETEAAQPIIQDDSRVTGDDPGPERSEDTLNQVKSRCPLRSAAHR